MKDQRPNNVQQKQLRSFDGENQYGTFDEGGEGCLYWAVLSFKIDSMITGQLLIGDLLVILNVTCVVN